MQRIRLKESDRMAWIIFVVVVIGLLAFGVSDMV